MIFQNNTGIINGSLERCMLRLDNGGSGGYVDWTGSSFTHSGGGWSGNEPSFNPTDPMYRSIESTNYGGTLYHP